MLDNRAHPTVIGDVLPPYFSTSVESTMASFNETLMAASKPNVTRLEFKSLSKASTGSGCIDRIPAKRGLACQRVVGPSSRSRDQDEKGRVQRIDGRCTVIGEQGNGMPKAINFKAKRRCAQWLVMKPPCQ